MDNIPSMLAGAELNKSLEVLPEYDESIMRESSCERLIGLQNLYSVYVPNAMSREIYSKMYLSMVRSLNKKKSINAVFQANENNRIIRKQSFESIIGGSDSFTIIGTSGIGKSAAVSRAISLLMTEEKIMVNNSIVLPCVQVQTPADCSIKGLLFEILRKIDYYLETNYYLNAKRARATLDMLIGSVSQVALNHIGLLVVDEIQNVVNSKNGIHLIGTLTQFINNSGISICMVGTPESAAFFGMDMMLARRTLGLEYDLMSYDDSFRSFCKTLLKYCYLQKQFVVNEGLLMWLYNHSSGNASVVVGLIHDAQEIAILDGTEKLDNVTLTAAYKRRFSMLLPYIEISQNSYSKEKRSLEPIISKESKIIISNCISEISAQCKLLKRDIVTELKYNNICIEEVEI